MSKEQVDKFLEEIETTRKELMQEVDQDAMIRQEALKLTKWLMVEENARRIADEMVLGSFTKDNKTGKFVPTVYMLLKDALHELAQKKIRDVQ